MFRKRVERNKNKNMSNNLKIAVACSSNATVHSTSVISPNNISNDENNAN